MILIAAVTIILFILSILLFPQIQYGKDRKRSFKIYPLIPLIGGLLMIPCGGLSFETAIASFTENSSVNPIRILVLFLSMTIFSLILEQTGFFEHISGIILQKAGHSQHRVFLSFYTIISILTIFTSNDIVILTFTPFICHFCRAAKIDPVPYLIMEFVAANTWSLFLLIGNPTNIYISGAFEIGFTEYLRTMALPTAAAGISSLVVMGILFRKKLRGEIHTTTQIAPITDRPLMRVSLLHLGGCVLLLSISQYVGLEMWLISLGMAISVLLCSVACLLLRKKNLAPLRRALGKIPYEIIPFIIGMFLIVLALESANYTVYAAELMENDEGIFTYGVFSFLASNVLNNIPMSVLFSKILAAHKSMGEIYATIIGSNIGAFITPVGALAGIMWLNLLKENRVKLSTIRFVVTGLLIGVPSIFAALLVLKIVL